MPSDGWNFKLGKHLCEADIGKPGEIRAHGLDAAPACPVADEPGVKAAGPQRRDAEHQVHDPLLPMSREVDALVAKHEPSVAVLAVGERAALLECREEIPELLRGTPPGWRLIGLEHHPPRAALDAVDDKQREAPGGQRTPVGRSGAGPRKRAGRRALATWPPHRLHGIDAGSCQPAALFVIDVADRLEARAKHGVIAAGARPHRPVL